MINVTVTTENGRTEVKVVAAENMQRLNIEGLALLLRFAEFMQKEIPLLWFAVGNKCLSGLYQQCEDFEKKWEDKEKDPCSAATEQEPSAVETAKD